MFRHGFGIRFTATPSLSLDYVPSSAESPIEWLSWAQGQKFPGQSDSCRGSFPSLESILTRGWLGWCDAKDAHPPSAPIHSLLLHTPTHTCSIRSTSWPYPSRLWICLNPHIDIQASNVQHVRALSILSSAFSFCHRTSAPTLLGLRLF